MELIPDIGSGSGYELPAGGAPTPVIVRVADVQPQPVEWLWWGQFALGKLTMIAGDPGLGKSFLTLDMAARVSRGTPWPDRLTERNPVGSVVLLSAEDDIGDTIRPRLDAAGADVNRISVVQGVRFRDDDSGQLVERCFNLESDLAALEQAVQAAKDCRLVVIDPITAYCGRTDSHKNAEVRGLLAPLADLAARHRVAVVAVTHLNKNAGSAAMYRTMGSLAFVAAARAVWAVVRDSDDPERRLFLPVKNNLGKDRSGLAYRFRESAVPDVPCLAWEPDAVAIDADEALAPRAGDADRQEREAAAVWLGEYLAGGRVPSKDIKAAARDVGFKWTTVRRARTLLGVKARRDGFGPGGVWYWSLEHRCPPNAIDAHSLDVSAYGPGEHLCGDGAGDDGDGRGHDGDSVGGRDTLGNRGDGVETAWRVERLRQLAAACEGLNPTLAAQHRAEADGLENRS